MHSWSWKNFFAPQALFTPRKDVPPRCDLLSAPTQPPRHQSTPSALFAPPPNAMRAAPPPQAPSPPHPASPQAAYDAGLAYWARVAALPPVAAALDGFRNEVETRPTKRLDLVSWAQYICGARGGPPREVWYRLFHACCFTECGLGEEGQTLRPPHVVLRFGVAKIAVLLAYAKCTADYRDSNTEHNVIKFRIRPAVEGRAPQARAFGILEYVRAKFDEFVYEIVSKGFVEAAKRDMDPEELVEPVLGLAQEKSPSSASAASGEISVASAADALATLRGYTPSCDGNTSDSQRSVESSDRNALEMSLQLVHSHVVAKMKEWEIVVSAWLGLCFDAAGDRDEEERIRVFQCKRVDVRSALWDSFFRKVYVRLWRDGAGSSGFHSASRSPFLPRPRHLLRAVPQHSPQYSRLSFDSDTSLISVGTQTLYSAYGAAPAGTLPSYRPGTTDSMSTCSATASVYSQLSLRSYSLDSAFDLTWLYDQARSSIYTDHVLQRLRLTEKGSPFGSVVAETRVTILEVHAPGGPMSTAALEFLPRDTCDTVHQSQLQSLQAFPMASRNGADFNRKACFFLAGAESEPSHAIVPGAPPHSRCRALQLVAEIVEVPADYFVSLGEGGCDGGGDRFRVSRLKGFEWVFLDNQPGRVDDCVELPSVDELNDEEEAQMGMGTGIHQESRPYLMNASTGTWGAEDSVNHVTELPIEFRARRNRVVRSLNGALYGVNVYEPGDMRDVDEDEVVLPVHNAEGDLEDVVRAIRIELDCNIDARFSYTLGGAVEIDYVPCNPNRNIFLRSKVWRWRRA